MASSGLLSMFAGPLKPRIQVTLGYDFGSNREGQHQVIRAQGLAEGNDEEGVR